MSVTYSALRAQYLEDTGAGGGGATPRLTRALESIGWRAMRDPSPEELAAHLVLLLDACVHEHRDPSMLEYAIALSLRDAGPWLDGGMPPVEAYIPAAAALLEQYLRGAVPPLRGIDWSALIDAE